MSIDDLKRALHKVNRICNTNYECDGTCPFFDGQRMICQLKGAPNVWFVDDWKKDTHDTADA